MPDLDERLRRAGDHFRATHAEPVPIHRPTADAPRRAVWFSAAAAAIVVVLAATLVTVLHHPGERASSPPDTSSPSTTGLIGPTWVLTSWSDAGAGNTVHGMDISLTFTADGFFGGDGCNGVRAQASISPTEIVFGRAIMTKMACGDLGSQSFFRHVISGRAQWSVAGDQLTLRSGTLVGHFHRDSDPSMLADTNWTMASWTVDGVSRSNRDVEPVYLAFVGTSRVRMSSGCTTSNATVAVERATLSMRGFGSSTPINHACSPPHEVVLGTVDVVIHDGTAAWTLAGTQLTLTRGSTSVRFYLSH